MTNEEKIWNYLLDKIKNPYGVAALMGNLYVESKLNPSLLQSSYSRKLGMSSAEYTDAVDKGKHDFVHDSAGYGLAQWTYWSRKEALYNFAVSKGKSIGDLDMQLEFMWKELQKYKTVLETLKTTKDIRAASDVVMLRYEKPANQSEEGKKNRASCGMNLFTKHTRKNSTKTVVVTADRVNVRSGNGKEFERFSLVNKGKTYEWVATAENGWHAVRLSDRVAWISGEFSKVE